MIPTIIEDVYRRLQNKDSFDKEEMQLYMDVLRFYNGDPNKLSKKSVSADEKRNLIIFLLSNGQTLKGPFEIIDNPGELKEYLVNENFKFAIEIARKVRDVCERAEIEEAKLRHGYYCPLALNSHDCKRLIVETKCLFSDTGREVISAICPTLAKLTEDLEDLEENTPCNYENGKMSVYPARHICELKKLNGRTENRYIHLRLMDMAFYEHGYDLSDKQLRDEINRYARKYGLEIKLPENLNNLRNIYKQLITDGIIGDSRKHHTRTRSVFETYKQSNDSEERVVAFKAEISLFEAFQMEKELNELISSEFNNDRDWFRQSFPLLYVFSNIIVITDNRKGNNDDEDISVSGFKNTVSAFVTVNYVYDELRSIRTKLIHYINYNIPVTISSEANSGKYLLRKLYDKRYEYIVDAVDIQNDDGKLKKLNPMDLITMQALDINDCSEEETKVLGKYAFRLGTDEPKDFRVRDITLELKRQGTDRLMRDKKWRKLHAELISQYDGPQPREYGDKVNIKVCLNTDFMKEIAYLDSKGYLFRIYPEDVMSAYEEYLCEHHNISERWPLEDRPVNSQKTLQKRYDISE